MGQTASSVHNDAHDSDYGPYGLPKLDLDYIDKECYNRLTESEIAYLKKYEDASDAEKEKMHEPIYSAYLDDFFRVNFFCSAHSNLF